MADYVNQEGLKEIFRNIKRDYAKKGELITISLGATSSGTLSATDLTTLSQNWGIVKLLRDNVIYYMINNSATTPLFAAVDKNGADFKLITITVATGAWTYTTTDNATQAELNALSAIVDTKVVQRTDTGVEVYSHNGSTQGGIEASNTPGSGKIPLYDSNGRIKTNNPSATNDVSTKQYVDNTVAALSLQITSGAITAQKALNDGNGNNIVNTYATKSGAGATVEMTMNPSTYVLSLTLKNNSGATLGTTQTVNLPLESTIISGTYDSVNQQLVLTLDTGQIINIPVSDLVDGLQNEITSQSPLESDLVDDTNQSNKFVSATEKAQITTNKEDIVALEARVDDEFAKKDGNYVDTGLAAAVADNLIVETGTIIDAAATEQSGDTYPDKANNAKGTGTFFPYGDNDWVTVENGNETIQKAYGHSYVKNQLSKELNSTNWSGKLATTFFDSRIATFTASSQYGRLEQTLPLISGHIVLFKFDIKGTSEASVKVSITINSGGGTTQTILNMTTLTSFETKFLIATIEQNTNYFSFIDTRTSGWNAIQVKNINVIDLTQLDQSLANTTGLTPEMVLKVYPDILNWEYNEGTMVDAEDFTYSSSGINQWDEEWELGYINNDGSPQSSSSYIRSKNFIQVLTDTTYYLKTSGIAMYLTEYDENGNFIKQTYKVDTTITTQSNTAKVKFYMTSTYGTTYNHDIQVCLHYTDTEVENTYHSYVAPSTKEIKYYGGKGRSAGSVTDEVDYVAKKRVKKVGSVDLGTLNWVKQTNGNMQSDGLQALIKKPASNSNQAGILCALYSANTFANVYNNTINKTIGVSTTGSIQIYDTAYTDAAAFKTAMSGVILNYELDTPVEEDIPTSEQNNILACNDYGIESKSDGVIAGMKVLYQMNAKRTIFNNKAEIAQLKQRVSTLESEVDAKDAILNEALGGTLRQLLVVKNESVDFLNTLSVDLGGLTWYYSSGEAYFYADVPNCKSNSVALCSSYKENTTASYVSQLQNKEIKFFGTSFIIKDTSFTDNTAFKNSLKGVLLAYEKASE